MSTRSINGQNTKTKALQRSSYLTKEQLYYDLSKSNVFLRLSFKHYMTSRWSSSFNLSCTFCCAYSTKTNIEKIPPVAKTDHREVKFNRVNCLLWVLHESAKSFSHDVESIELTRNGPELAMAWTGKDIHEWHKRIAYFVRQIYVPFPYKNIPLLTCLT